MGDTEAPPLVMEVLPLRKAAVTGMMKSSRSLMAQHSNPTNINKAEEAKRSAEEKSKKSSDKNLNDHDMPNLEQKKRRKKLDAKRQEKSDSLNKEQNAGGADKEVMKTAETEETDSVDKETDRKIPKTASKRNDSTPENGQQKAQCADEADKKETGTVEVGVRSTEKNKQSDGKLPKSAPKKRVSTQKNAKRTVAGADKKEVEAGGKEGVEVVDKKEEGEEKTPIVNADTSKNAQKTEENANEEAGGTEKVDIQGADGKKLKATPKRKSSIPKKLQQKKEQIPNGDDKKEETNETERADGESVDKIKEAEEKPTATPNRKVSSPKSAQASHDVGCAFLPTLTEEQKEQNTDKEESEKVDGGSEGLKEKADTKKLKSAPKRRASTPKNAKGCQAKKNVDDDKKENEEKKDESGKGEVNGDKEKEAEEPPKKKRQTTIVSKKNVEGEPKTSVDTPAEGTEKADGEESGENQKASKEKKLKGTPKERKKRVSKVKEGKVADGEETEKKDEGGNGETTEKKTKTPRKKKEKTEGGEETPKTPRKRKSDENASAEKTPVKRRKKKSDVDNVKDDQEEKEKVEAATGGVQIPAELILSRKRRGRPRSARDDSPDGDIIEVRREEDEVYAGEVHPEDVDIAQIIFKPGDVFIGKYKIIDMVHVDEHKGGTYIVLVDNFEAVLRLNFLQSGGASVITNESMFLDKVEKGDKLFLFGTLHEMGIVNGHQPNGIVFYTFLYRGGPKVSECARCAGWPNKGVSERTIGFIGTGILSVIEQVYKLGYVMRNLSLEQFRVDARSRQIFLFDRSDVVVAGDCLIAAHNIAGGLKLNLSWSGTREHAPSAFHTNGDRHIMNAGDAAEALFYVLLELLLGRLPWGLEGITDELLLTMKRKSMAVDDALSTLYGIPKPLRTYWMSLQRVRNVNKVFKNQNLGMDFSSLYDVLREMANNKEAGQELEFEKKEVVNPKVKQLLLLRDENEDLKQKLVLYSIFNEAAAANEDEAGEQITITPSDSKQEVTEDD